MNVTSLLSSAKSLRPYHILVSAATGFLLFIAVRHYYQFATAPTDENFYTTSPSNLYVAGTLKADRLVAGADDGRFVPDSIQIGDLITIVQGERVVNLVEFRSVLEKYKDTPRVSLRVVRPRLNTGYYYEISPAILEQGFFSALPPSAFVFYVFPGGASDRAGMQAGDIIIRVNRQYFENAWQADAIIREAQAGKTIAYEVVRRNRILTLQVTLAELDVPFETLLLFLAGIVYFVIGYFLAIHSSSSWTGRLSSFAWILLGFAIATSWTRGSGTESWTDLAMTAFRIGSVICSIALFAHAQWYFPSPVKDHRARRLLIRLPYVIAFTGGLIALILLSIKMVIMIIAVLVAFNIWTAIVINSVAEPAYRAMSKTLRVGLLFSGFFLALVYVVIPELMAIPIALFPVVYLYVVSRYHILDIRLRVRRNIQYIIASAMWAIAGLAAITYAVVVISGHRFPLPPIRITSTGLEWSNVPLSPEEQKVVDRVLVVLMMLAIGAIIWRLYQWGRVQIDKRFYRADHDYKRASNELTEVMASNLDMQELVNGIVKRLASLMHLKRVAMVLFRNERTSCCATATGFESDRWIQFCSEYDTEILRELQSDHTDSRLSSHMMSASLAKAFGTMGLRQIVSIRSKDRLVGAIVLGDKLSDTPFNREDYEYLNAVAKQASIAIENAFLFENLAEQNRLKHELDLARRIQLNSLPQQIPDVSGLDIAGRSIPAQEVGGDYFDYFSKRHNHFMVVVGDVSGKGTSAALYMSKVQGILHTLHSFDLSPRDLFVRSNRILSEDLSKDSFVTSLGAEFDTTAHTVRFARAGHVPLFYYSKHHNSVELIRPDGLGLGLVDTMVFEQNLHEEFLHFSAGDIFVFVTDGVTEAHSASGVLFDDEKVVDLIRSERDADAGGLLNKLLDAVIDHTGRSLPHDDQTVVVVKVKE